MSYWASKSHESLMSVFFKKTPDNECYDVTMLDWVQVLNTFEENLSNGVWHTCVF